MLSKPLKKFLIASLSIAGGILGLGAFLIWHYQDKLIYFPSVSGQHPKDNPYGYRTPDEANLKYEDVIIPTSDGVNLRGWFIKYPMPNQYPTFVVFHGNAGNIGYRIPFVKRLHRDCYVNVLIVAYRGYSDSEGIPTEKGLQQDALAVMDHVFSRQDIDTKRIYVHGTSLGGAVATYALSQKQYNAAGLILENTFTSMADMVDQVMPKVSKLKRFLLANHWETINRIGRIKVPILFISGLKDELIPPEQMKRLYDAAKESRLKEILGIEDATHNDTWAVGGSRYFQGIVNFIKKVEKKVENKVENKDNRVYDEL